MELKLSAHCSLHQSTLSLWRYSPPKASKLKIKVYLRIKANRKKNHSSKMTVMVDLKVFLLPYTRAVSYSLDRKHAFTTMCPKDVSINHPLWPRMY